MVLVWTATVRANHVDQVLYWEVEWGCCYRGTDGAGLQVLSALKLGDLSASFAEVFTRCLVDFSVNSFTARKPIVCSGDQDITLYTEDISNQDTELAVATISNDERVHDVPANRNFVIYPFTNISVQGKPLPDWFNS